MKTVDFSFFLAAIILLLFFIVVFIYGKRGIISGRKKTVFMLIPIFIVMFLLFTVFNRTRYYEKQLALEQQRFIELQKKQFYNDSILLDQSNTRMTLDSLELLQLRLKSILKEINKQDKVTGDHSLLKENVRTKIAETDSNIQKIESYNEIIGDPMYLKEGYITSGTTASFTFTCPSKTQSEFIDLKFMFQDKSLVNKIACIYITAFEEKEDKSLHGIFRQSYLPREGLNAFKIRNYFNYYRSHLEIGYFLNQDTLKTEKNKYPRFYKVTCPGN